MNLIQRALCFAESKGEVALSSILGWLSKHTPFVKRYYNYSGTNPRYLTLPCEEVIYKDTFVLDCTVHIDTLVREYKEEFCVYFMKKKHTLRCCRYNDVLSYTHLYFKASGILHLCENVPKGTIPFNYSLAKESLPLRWGGELNYALDIEHIKSIIDLPQDFLNGITPSEIKYKETK